jgi:hypothetical protein
LFKAVAEQTVRLIYQSTMSCRLQIFPYHYHSTMASTQDTISLTNQLHNTTINDNKPKTPGLYDEQYAQAPEYKDMTSQGWAEFNVRTNFFAFILGGSLPQKLRLYSFAFPQISNRDLKNNTVKRDLIRLVLSPPFFSALSQDLAPDWNGLLVSKCDLAEQKGAAFTGGRMDVPVSWQNQAQPGQTTDLTIGVTFLRVLDLFELQTCMQKQDPDDPAI